MQAGDLDRRLDWQRAAKTTDDFGNVTETWSTLFSAWCRKIPIRGQEAIMASEIVDSETVKVQIRWRSDVMTVDQFVFEGKTYRVQSMTEIGRRDGIEVLGAARTDQ